MNQNEMKNLLALLEELGCRCDVSNNRIWVWPPFISYRSIGLEPPTEERSDYDQDCYDSTGYDPRYDRNRKKEALLERHYAKQAIKIENSIKSAYPNVITEKRGGMLTIQRGEQ